MDEEKPVLKIKKDSEKELIYHYNREERISLRGPLKNDTRPKSKFKIFSHPFLIIFINLCAVFLIFNVIQKLAYNNGNEFSLAGYEVRIEAILWENTVLAKAIFTKAGKESGPQTAVRVDFSLEKSKGSIVCEETLNGQAAETHEIARLLESDKKNEVLVARVVIGNEEKTITCVPENK
jgi:hypothetical protein